MGVLQKRVHYFMHEGAKRPEWIKYSRVSAKHTRSHVITRLSIREAVQMFCETALLAVMFREKSMQSALSVVQFSLCFLNLHNSLDDKPARIIHGTKNLSIEAPATPTGISAIANNPFFVLFAY